jgi:hypothetical protein
MQKEDGPSIISLLSLISLSLSLYFIPSPLVPEFMCTVFNSFRLFIACMHAYVYSIQLYESTTVCISYESAERTVVFCFILTLSVAFYFQIFAS